MMLIQDRIIAFNKLCEVLKCIIEEKFDSISDENIRNLSIKFGELTKNVQNYNSWFIPSFVINALKEISDSLQLENLNKWLSSYTMADDKNNKSIKVALIMAGNIPLVGFHDLLCVLITGNTCLIKLSSDDNQLIPSLLDILCSLEPRFKANIDYTEDKIVGFDAVIATGSNNTSRYFEYYFGKIPHIIRKNRNSIAILSGNESKNDLSDLASDLLLYFGMGCRSVSKLFVPKNYSFNDLFEAIEPYANVFKTHNKYMNNYTYYRAIYLINQDAFLDNNFFMVRNSKDLYSPISTISYENYTNLDYVLEFINNNKENLQCIVSNTNIISNSLKFGCSQKPNLWDYADNVDTIKFLTKLKS